MNLPVITIHPEIRTVEFVWAGPVTTPAMAAALDSLPDQAGWAPDQHHLAVFTRQALLGDLDTDAVNATTRHLQDWSERHGVKAAIKGASVYEADYMRPMVEYWKSVAAIGPYSRFRGFFDRSEALDWLAE